MNFTEQQNSNKSSCRHLFNHQDASCFWKTADLGLKGDRDGDGACHFHVNAASPICSFQHLWGCGDWQAPTPVRGRAVQLHFLEEIIGDRNNKWYSRGPLIRCREALQGRRQWQRLRVSNNPDGGRSLLVKVLMVSTDCAPSFSLPQRMPSDKTQQSPQDAKALPSPFLSNTCRIHVDSSKTVCPTGTHGRLIASFLPIHKNQSSDNWHRIRVQLIFSVIFTKHFSKEKKNELIETNLSSWKTSNSKVS